jgi:hypothetical protein
MISVAAPPPRFIGAFEAEAHSVDLYCINENSLSTASAFVVDKTFR